MSAQKKPNPSARSSPPTIRYVVVWWHVQIPYIGMFENESEAALYASARNGLVIEIIGEAFSIGRVEDWWRRDENDNPMPAEWRTPRNV